jgi:predicted O-methyltransferase YrrM
MKFKNRQEALTYLLQACRQKNLLASGRVQEYVHHTPKNKYLLEKDFILLDPWEAEYLFRVAEMSKHNIVELGRAFGGSTLLLAAATNSRIKSIDNAKSHKHDYFVTRINKFNFKNIDLHTDDSQKTKLSDGRFKYDLVFIDGDHSYEGVMADMENWWNNLEPGGHYVLHDCHTGWKISHAVCEFIKDKDIIMHVPPVHNNKYYLHPYGSICHFQKKL